MFPTGYFVSSGPCFSRDVPTGYFVSSGDNCDLARRSNRFLCSFGRHHSLACRPCLQRCFQLAIASLLDSVFQRCYQLVIASLLEIFAILLEDQIDFCALFGKHHSLACRPCLQKCFRWLLILFWALFSRDVTTWLFFSSGDIRDLARRSNRFLCSFWEAPQSCL